MDKWEWGHFVWGKPKWDPAPIFKSIHVTSLNADESCSLWKPSWEQLEAAPAVSASSHRHTHTKTHTMLCRWRQMHNSTCCCNYQFILLLPVISCSIRHFSLEIIRVEITPLYVFEKYLGKVPLKEAGWDLRERGNQWWDQSCFYGNDQKSQSALSSAEVSLFKVVFSHQVFLLCDILVTENWNQDTEVVYLRSTLSHDRFHSICQVFAYFSPGY